MPKLLDFELNKAVIISLSSTRATLPFYMRLYSKARKNQTFKAFISFNKDLFSFKSVVSMELGKKIAITEELLLNDSKCNIGVLEEMQTLNFLIKSSTPLRVIATCEFPVSKVLC